VGIVLSEQIENTYLIEFSNVENTQNAANVELQVRESFCSYEIQSFRRASRQHNRMLHQIEEKSVEKQAAYN
jgi:hypothetical protein